MKYSMLLALLASAVDAQVDFQSKMLLEMGFPECSLKCVAEGAKAATAVGCSPTDSSCSCPGGKGGEVSNAATGKCLMETNVCTPDQMALLAPASMKICGNAKAAAPASSSGPASSPTAQASGAARASSISSAAAAQSTSKGAAAPQKTFAAGVMAVAGLAAAMLV